MIKHLPEQVFFVKKSFPEQKQRLGIAGLPDLSWDNMTKRGKIYQIISQYIYQKRTTVCTK
jgi:hypothetical protein